MVSHDAMERSVTSFFGPPSEASFGSSESRSLEREKGSSDLSRQLQSTLCTSPAHGEELVPCHQ